ncbi:hypothetical protein D4Q52_13720 [Rhodopseudomonas palustris]|uniref:Uncharacterized protein n=1 Tax=Rhodopseudomonas palustris TaxID=1076 RepID=A0A418VD52_RHOPL|nr:hypothetical protein D4Q52_13720 [Rhodopseudomonas palustris]
MNLAPSLPADFLAELERKHFWWEPIGDAPRSASRIVAQAMSFANFAEIRQLETVLGPEALTDVMLAAQPGWIDPRSWELWRGRLQRATGRPIPEEPPQRTFDADDL